ncbi:gamma-aminobutyric acid receptor subunit theta [Carlito syrichta]|uniref:Gamma-aminobutyric acid receptor subunit theta n=1 Tax=Carlito syrichta TaxID=1868482 RepID=A0A1U7SGX1_CARSF|nr:gamma-aminobutyric acid receptor subunit theta [Carlito syrichta]
MGARGVLEAIVFLLCINSWFAEDPSPFPKFHFEFSSEVPSVVQDLFNCKNCANEEVVGKILNRVLSAYDIRLRPNFGGAPVIVKVSIYVSSIEQISEVNMDYTITMFFHQTWKDSRLAYYETNLNLTLDYRMHEKLWVPDCYFLNSKDAFVHDVTVENRVFQLHPDGTVRYGMRITTTAACSLDLRKFPMDKQTCNLEVESYGYTVEDILLFWEDKEEAVYMTEELQIPQFSLLGKKITSKEVYFYTGTYMRLILKFQVQREITSYLLRVYWPTVLTTVLSWMSFWMNYQSSAARVTVGLTAMLILTSIDSSTREKLPHISYVKAVDVYILVCLFFVFLSLLEYVYINYFFYTPEPQRLLRQRRQRRIHRVPRRVVAPYRYQEVVVEHAQDGVANVEDGISSPPTAPAQAPLASPESLGSLASTSEEAKLATSESLSSLSSLSGQAQLATGESLSDLPSTSEQAQPSNVLHPSGGQANERVIPTEIRHRAEVHVHAEVCIVEDSEDKSHGHGQRGVQEAGGNRNGDNNELRRRLDPEEQVRREPGNALALRDNEEGGSQEGSGSDSEESSPASPGFSLSDIFCADLFSPDMVPVIDRWCRFLFPLAFGLFNIAYWTYHLY